MFLNMYDQTHPMPATTQNVSQHVLNIPLPCHREQKIHLNFCRADPSNANDDSTRASTCVDQSPPMPARTRNVYQHVLTKPIPYHQGQKMYLNMFDQTLPMQASTQNVSQHLLSKPLLLQHGNNMYLNIS
jgi:hypothetical protein